MADKTQAAKQKKTLLKLIDKYYADLARQRVFFEMAIVDALPAYSTETT